MSDVKSKKSRKKVIQDEGVCELVVENNVEAKQKPRFVLVIKNDSHLRYYEPHTRTAIEPNSQVTVYCLSALQQKTVLSHLEQIKQNNPLVEVHYA